MLQPVIIWKWLADVLEWLKELLLYLPLHVWDGLLDGLASLVEAIPVPAFMQNLGSLFAGLSPGIAYFLSPLSLGTGVSMVLSAYAIRFLIRRIPLIG
jgi:hypothetical protein